jgi:hypothetical protein
MENIKKYFKIILKGLVLLLAIFAVVVIFKECNGEETKQTVSIDKPDTLRPKIQVNKTDIKVLADSVPIYREMAKQANNRKNYYKGLYKSTYDSLYDLSDSIGKIRLAITESIKLKQDSANEAQNEANVQLIINAFNQIGEYQDNEILYEQKIKQDSTEKEQLKQDLKTEQESKVKYWKGFWTGAKWGTVFGIAVDESARAGIRMIKP